MSVWDRILWLDQQAGTHRDYGLDSDDHDRCPVHHVLLGPACPECDREAYEGEKLLRARWEASRK